MPEPGDPSAEDAHTAHRILADTEYAFQKHALERTFELSGDDVFVATHTLGRRPDGSTLAWTARVEGVTAGPLPEADFVGMVDEANASFVVTWEDALALAGPWLVRDPNLSPPRWHGNGWPPPEIVEGLPAVATEI